MRPNAHRWNLPTFDARLLAVAGEFARSHCHPAPTALAEHFGVSRAFIARRISHLRAAGRWPFSRRVDGRAKCLIHQLSAGRTPHEVAEEYERITGCPISAETVRVVIVREELAGMGRPSPG